MNWIALRKPLLLGLLMLAAAGLTIAATPHKRMADMASKVDLEQMIPRAFGAWRIDPNITPVTVSPDVQAQLDQIYNQTLARTYVNDNGTRVMLSIAYGGDQSDGMSAHRPEVCYSSQGFDVIRTLVEQMRTQYGAMPVKRLVAKKGWRREPITYWIVVGEQIAVDGLGQKLAQLRYGLTGTIPDGMLVRVSTIGSDDAAAFEVQNAFLAEMLAAVEQPVRRRLAGAFDRPS